MWQISEDVRGMLRAGLYTVAETLQGIDDILSACLLAAKLPTDEQTAQLQDFSDASGTPMAIPAPVSAPVPEWQAHVSVSTSAENRHETPPIAYWRQWSEGTGPPTAVNAEPPTAHPAANTTYSASMATMNETNKTGPDHGLRNQRIYRLTKHGMLAKEIHLHLEQTGVDLELLDSVDELLEPLRALPADLLLLDAEFAFDQSVL